MPCWRRFPLRHCELKVDSFGYLLVFFRPMCAFNRLRKGSQLRMGFLVETNRISVSRIPFIPCIVITSLYVTFHRLMACGGHCVLRILNDDQLSSTLLWKRNSPVHFESTFWEHTGKALKYWRCPGMQKGSESTRYIRLDVVILDFSTLLTFFF